MNFLPLCFWIVVITSSVDSAKILGVFYTPVYSRFLAGSALMKILAEKGHEVTIVSLFHEKNPPKNYSEVYLDGLFKRPKGHSINHYDSKDGAFSTIWNANTYAAPLLNRIMSHPKFQFLLKSNTTYDLVIIEQFVCDALMYLAKHFNAPLIGFSTLDATSWTNRYVGNPTFPAYIPHVLFGFHRMNFWQRLENTLLFLVEEITFHLKVLPNQNEILQSHVPGAPDLDEIIYNTSITFLNADIAIHDPIPKVPGMINIGGFHINPQPLSEKFSEIFETAENGVIYFSFGTSVKSKDMPADKLAILLKVFSQLNETVLWKWENADLPGKPDNVITEKWVPQQDILAHENLKLFISHGGLMSIIESVHYGVPMLLFPLEKDQPSNAARAEEDGYAKSMQFSDISESSLLSSIKEILENPKYKSNAKRRSDIMKLKPMSPKDTIVFWAEYVIKNRGAPHLQVASLKMPWYQYMLLDILAFTLLVNIFIVITVYYSIKYTVYICRKKMNKL